MYHYPHFGFSPFGFPAPLLLPLPHIRTTWFVLAWTLGSSYGNPMHHYGSHAEYGLDGRDWDHEKGVPPFFVEWHNRGSRRDTRSLNLKTQLNQKNQLSNFLLKIRTALSSRIFCGEKCKACEVVFYSLVYNYCWTTMKTILIVDNEPKIIQLVHDYLERAGFSILPLPIALRPTAGRSTLI